jgi:hypothetical protein
MNNYTNQEEIKLKDFAKGKWDLEILSDGEITYQSGEPGIKPVIDFIKKSGTSLLSAQEKNLIIYDKIVGQAVALLFVLLKVKKVYGIIGSKKAEEVLKKSFIPHLFLQTVPYITNRDKTGPCPFEKLSEGKSPEEFWELVSEKF